jgi:Uma2 family endonuclease
MAGGSLDHSAIGLNVGRLLQDALEGRPRWVYNSDAATRLSPCRYTFPDASVTCDPRDRGRVMEVQSPRLTVEVLSDTTEAYDRSD